MYVTLLVTSPTWRSVVGEAEVDLTYFVWQINLRHDCLLRLLTLFFTFTYLKICFNPPQKSVPKGRRHKAGGAEVPSGQIVEGGLKGNDQKK